MPSHTIEPRVGNNDRLQMEKLLTRILIIWDWIHCR